MQLHIFREMKKLLLFIKNMKQMISITAAFISAIKDNWAKQYLSVALDLYRKAIYD